jgi:hypothetical protein
MTLRDDLFEKYQYGMKKAPKIRIAKKKAYAFLLLLMLMQLFYYVIGRMDLSLLLGACALAWLVLMAFKLRKGSNTS